MTKWIFHNGGECPVNPNDLVKVVTDGCYVITAKASELDWQHVGLYLLDHLNNESSDILERLKFHPSARVGIAAAEEIKHLRSKVIELLADAERYRWLRSRNPDNDYCIQCGYDGLSLHVGNDLDAAIDAARKESK